VFNATFSNISAISWGPVLVVEEARVPGENRKRTKQKDEQWSTNYYTEKLKLEQNEPQ
jgi:hypothetical protein